MLLLSVQESRRYTSSSKYEKRVGSFSCLSIRQTRSSSNQLQSLETSSMDAHEVTSLPRLVPPLLPSCLSLLLVQPLQWQPDSWTKEPPWDPGEIKPSARGAENTNSQSNQKINSALSDDSHLSTLICGWPYISINVDLFTLGIFKVRFVYSCSDSSYSYANNKP